MAIATILTWMALAVHQPTDIDITASLHGYNLLWPSSRCCAFTFHIAKNGDASIEANISTGRMPKKYSRHFTLTPEQMSNIRHAIDEVTFFELPDSICCGPMDGDNRTIIITEGDKTHRVSFDTMVPPEQAGKLDRIRKLWSIITAILKIPGANVK